MCLCVYVCVCVRERETGMVGGRGVVGCLSSQQHARVSWKKKGGGVEGGGGEKGKKHQQNANGGGISESTLQKAYRVCISEIFLKTAHEGSSFEKHFQPGLTERKRIT